MIQALVRGFLVRNRRYHLLAKVLLIQRRYREWGKRSKGFREARLEKCRNRKQKATMIQRKFRNFSEGHKVRLIQAPDKDAELRQRVLEARQNRLENKRK